MLYQIFSEESLNAHATTLLMLLQDIFLNSWQYLIILCFLLQFGILPWFFLEIINCQVVFVVVSLLYIDVMY